MKVAPRTAGVAWRLGLAVGALALASVGGRAQGTPTISVGDVTIAEGNSGLTYATFPVTIANANGIASSVSFFADDGTAVGGSTPQTFRAAGPFAIPDGTGTPARISIDVSGSAAPVVSMSVVMEFVAHASTADLDLLLVSPDRRSLVFQSDAIGIPLNGTNSYVLKDGQPLLPANGVPGFNSPTSYAPADVFGAPAPPGPHPEAAPSGTATLDGTFRGLDPNGVWEVFGQDDTPGNAGTIGGVRLILDTPEAGTDFYPSSGVLRFLPGGPTTLTVTVPIYGDTVVEPDETFTVNLSSPTNAVIGDGQAIGTITNDDGGAGRPPTAVNDSYSPDSPGVLVVPADRGVLVNDDSNGGGPMTATIFTGARQGTVTLSPDGGFTYIPPPFFFGTDSFEYRARNANGDSNIATVTITRSLPTGGPPTNLNVVGVIDDGIDRHVHVRFDPPSGTPPVQYALAGGTQAGETLALLPTGSAFPTYKISTPLTGSYFIRMHASDGTTLSGPSNEVPLHLTTAVPPSPPVDLLGLVNGSDVHLVWQHTFGGGIPTNALLRVSGAASLVVPLGSTDSFSFSNVPTGTYTIDMVESNDGGVSPPSAAVTLTFPGPCSGPPEMPEDYLLSTRGREIDVSFFTTRGPAPTGYKADVRSPGFNGEVPLPRRSVSAAVPPGVYQIRVAASNPCGDSPWTPFQEVAVPVG